MDLHQRMTQLMAEKRITYTELEKMTGISHSTLNRYCIGRSDRIPASRLKLIANALGTTPEYLLGFDSREDEAVEMARQMLASGISLDDLKLALTAIQLAKK